MYTIHFILVIPLYLRRPAASRILKIPPAAVSPHAESQQIIGVGTLWPYHFAIVMLGTPTRGTSVTVIWNNRYSNWKASRFQRADGPVVFTA